jgi:hypothetical protein
MDYGLSFFENLYASPSPSPKKMAATCVVDEFSTSLLWMAVKGLFAYALIRDVVVIFIPYLVGKVHAWVLHSLEGVPAAIEAAAAATEEFIEKEFTKKEETIDLTGEEEDKAGSATWSDVLEEAAASAERPKSSLLKKTLDIPE